MSRTLRSTSHTSDTKYFGLPDSDSPALEGNFETVETYDEEEGSGSERLKEEDQDDEEIDGNQKAHFLIAQEKLSPKSVPTLQIIHRLLTSSLADKGVRTSVPQKTMANCSIVVHIPHSTTWKILLSDGLGVWKASKGPTNIFVRKDIDADLIVATAINREEYGSEADTYYFQRRTFVNQSCPQYHRTIVSSADQRCEFAYLHYYFRDAVEHEFEITVTGKNRHTTRVRFAGPSPSPVGRPVKKSRTSESESAVNILTSNELLIPLSLSYPEHLSPSGVLLKTGSLPDSLEEVIAKCNQEVKTLETFILEVIVAPEPKIFLSNRRQLNDIRRFCTQHDSFGILCKDVLANAGDSGYCVTFTVYEHLLLKGKDGRHPCVLGPMFVHRNADFYTGYEFAVALVKYELAAQNLTAYGPSSDTELDRAFQIVFPNAKRYVPPGEIEEIVSKKLAELEIRAADADSVKQGIFGLLTDAVPPNDLDEHVYQLMDTWQSLHQNGTEFGQYFLNSIFVQLRQNSELKKRSGGSTPDVYAQQVSSQMKAFIKKCCTKKCTLPELIRKLREIVWKQEKELEGAVVGKSDLKLEPAYIGLQYNEADFFNASKTPMSQRRVILNRIHEQELL